jgi:hypothetical protein
MLLRLSLLRLHSDQKMPLYINKIKENQLNYLISKIKANNSIKDFINLKKEIIKVLFNSQKISI